MLALINIYENIDDFSEYIEEEFLRDQKIVPRDEVDNTIRGNSYILNELILKLKSSEKFLSIIKHFFDINNTIEIRNPNGEPLGWYNPNNNITYQINGSMVGFGDLLTSLLH